MSFKSPLPTQLAVGFFYSIDRFSQVSQGDQTQSHEHFVRFVSDSKQLSEESSCAFGTKAL